jgi:hypothetical protein
MHRFTTRGLFLSLCLLSLCASAQENRVIRVGVPTMENRAGRGVPGNVERDRLVAALNQEKPDKKLHIKVQGVPLDATTPDEVASETKQKNCDYVVYTTLVELQASTDPTMPRSGTAQTNPGGVWTSPNQAETNAVNPEYRATVEYKLYRSGNPTAISGAPFSNREMMSELEVVAQIMNRIASRVFAEVKKAPPPMQE